MKTIQIMKNVPITINGCKCVINADLVTLRSLVITVKVTKRRGQLVKANWKNVFENFEEFAPLDYSVFRRVIDTATLSRYADGVDIYRYVKDNFTCEKYVNLTNPNAAKELLIILN